MRIKRRNHYEIGDKVLIRSWDDMAREFGLDEDGDIDMPVSFTADMKNLCDKILTVKYVTSDNAYLMKEDLTGFMFFTNYFAGKVVFDSEDETIDSLQLQKCGCYKIGDKVLIRDWGDMAREFGTFSGVSINTPSLTFYESMAAVCNHVCTITSVDEDGDYCIEEKDDFWYPLASIVGKVVSNKKSDYFHSVTTTWCDDDIRSALEIDGIEASDEAIHAVASEEFVRFFNEALQERANEMIAERIAVLQKHGAFSEWICTDPDCKQYCKPCGDHIFKFIEKAEILVDDEQTDCIVHTASIDLDYYDLDEMLDIIRSYGYKTVEDVKDDYGDASDRIIAECIFESLLGINTSKMMTEEEADAYIEKYIKEN